MLLGTTVPFSTTDAGAVIVEVDLNSCLLERTVFLGLALAGAATVDVLFSAETLLRLSPFLKPLDGAGGWLAGLAIVEVLFSCDFLL